MAGGTVGGGMGEHPEKRGCEEIAGKSLARSDWVLYNYLEISARIAQLIAGLINTEFIKEEIIFLKDRGNAFCGAPFQGF